MKIKFENTKLTPKKKMKMLKRLRKLIVLFKLQDSKETLIVSNVSGSHRRNRQIGGYVERLDENTIFMFLNPKSADKLEILCHEFVHVKQYVLRELSLLYSLETKKPCAIIWKGQVWLDNNPSCPWELEAYGAQAKLARIITA